VSRGAAIGWVRVGLVVGSILLLEWLCRTGRIDHRTLIPPSEMAARLTDLFITGDIVNDTIETFTCVGAAFFLAVSAGFLAGVVIHAVPRLRRALNPLLASYYSIPFFVFYPLFIAFFGLNKIPLIVIGFVFAAAAMVLATLGGLDRVPSSLIKSARIMRLSGAQTVRLITLPAAAPYLFAGLKLALAYAFIGVIAGEFILSGGGLGYSIAYAYNNFDNDTMYATMLFVLIVATIMNGILHTWEQRLLRRRGLAG
jgi:NitT/TauT family transport system permease protein